MSIPLDMPEAVIAIIATLILLASWSWIGYPVWLLSLGLVRRRPSLTTTQQSANALPSVSIVVSAYNEAAVIADKLQNVIELDFPRDQLECVVISDCSDDGTDEIVGGFDSTLVTLHRMPERKGKSAGLTQFVPECRHDLIVFTDANAMFRRDALQKLVCHFADPEVGYVVGQQKYIECEGDQVGESEGLYWKYETFLKTLESRVDSVVGGDGAIYGIRRELFKPLRVDDINDFINPLQIIQAGYRGVYEPHAICTEHVAGSFGGEYRRKVRIVNRSFRAFVREIGAANPFRTGVFAFHLISHKVLRWFTAYFLFLAYIASLVAVIGSPTIFALGVFAAQSSLYFLAVLGLSSRLRELRLISVPFYFCLGNLAAAHGIFHYGLGKRYTTWRPDRAVTGDAAEGRIAKGPLRWSLPLVVSTSITASVLAPTLTIGIGVMWIFVTLVMFPAVLRWIAGQKHVVSSANGESQSTDSAALRPLISVIIPARNEAVCIEQKIRNTLEWDYPSERMQILVVDDASNDATGSIAKEFGDQIELISLAVRGGKPMAVREAFSHARGEIIVLSDANVHVLPDAASHLIEELRDLATGCAVADVRLVAPDELLRAERSYQSYEFRLLTQESRLASAVCVDGGLYAIQRDCLTLPADDCILDDFAISAAVINLGMKIKTVPAARAMEASSTNLADEFRRRKRLGRGVAQSLRRGTHPRITSGIAFLLFVFHKWTRWMIPWLAMAMLLSVLVLSATSPTWLSLSIATAVFLIAFPWVLPGSYLRWIPLGRAAAFGNVVLTGMGYGMLLGFFSDKTAPWTPAKRTQITVTEMPSPRSASEAKTLL